MSAPLSSRPLASSCFPRYWFLRPAFGTDPRAWTEAFPQQVLEKALGVDPAGTLPVLPAKLCAPGAALAMRSAPSSTTTAAAAATASSSSVSLVGRVAREPWSLPPVPWECGVGAGKPIAQPPLLLTTAQRGFDWSLDTQLDSFEPLLRRAGFNFRRVEVTGSNHLTEISSVGVAGGAGETVLVPAVIEFVASHAVTDTARTGSSRPATASSGSDSRSLSSSTGNV